MEDKAKAQDYRGTWKDWPFIAAIAFALVLVLGAMSGGHATWQWFVVALLVLTGLIRGGTFSPRR